MDAEFVVRAFDWSSIGDATVVDVCSCLFAHTVYHSLFVDIANWVSCGDRSEVAVVMSVGALQPDFQTLISSSRTTQRHSSQAKKRCHWI